VSTPPFLDPPPGTRTYRLATPRGDFAVLDTEPAADRVRGTALLVPGYTGSKEDFIAVLAELAASGRRVVAVDQRGQHESPGSDEPGAYALSELAADALAIVDTLGDGPVHLLGHSFGGLVAREVALTSAPALRSVTLLSSGPAAVPGASADRARLMLQALGSYDLPTLYEAMLAVMLQDGVKPPEDPAVAEFLRRRFVGNHPASLRAMSRHLLEEPDRVADLAAVDVPKLVVYGEHDDAWPPHVQADMAERLWARHAVIQGALHSPAVEQPEITAAELTAFWAAVEEQAQD
jgi:pimeloyl-ACP methyl ester carboxylesterase